MYFSENFNDRNFTKYSLCILTGTNKLSISFEFSLWSKYYNLLLRNIIL